MYTNSINRPSVPDNYSQPDALATPSREHREQMGRVLRGLSQYHADSATAGRRASVAMGIAGLGSLAAAAAPLFATAAGARGSRVANAIAKTFVTNANPFQTFGLGFAGACLTGASSQSLSNAAAHDEQAKAYAASADELRMHV